MGVPTTILCSTRAGSATCKSQLPSLPQVKNTYHRDTESQRTSQRTFGICEFGSRIFEAVNDFRIRRGSRTPQSRFRNPQSQFCSVSLCLCGGCSCRSTCTSCGMPGSPPQPAHLSLQVLTRGLPGSCAVCRGLRFITSSRKAGQNPPCRGPQFRRAEGLLAEAGGRRRNAWPIS